MLEIKDRLKKIRLDNNLTQLEFGKKLNISSSQIGCYENGIRKITERVIKDVCREFDINEQWLLTGEGEIYKPQPQIDELEYLMGKFSINAEEDETRTKIIKALLKLDDNGWRVIEGLVDDILKDVKN